MGATTSVVDSIAAAAAAAAADAAPAAVVVLVDATDVVRLCCWKLEEVTTDDPFDAVESRIGEGALPLPLPLVKMRASSENRACPSSAAATSLTVARMLLETGGYGELRCDTAEAALAGCCLLLLRAKNDGEEVVPPLPVPLLVSRVEGVCWPRRSDKVLLLLSFGLRKGFSEKFRDNDECAESMVEAPMLPWVLPREGGRMVVSPGVGNLLLLLSQPNLLCSFEELPLW